MPDVCLLQPPERSGCARKMRPPLCRRQVIRGREVIGGRAHAGSSSGSRLPLSIVVTLRKTEPHPEERALARVSKDEAPLPQLGLMVRDARLCRAPHHEGPNSAYVSYFFTSGHSLASSGFA